MRTHPARWEAPTTLSFVPALVSLWAANWMLIHLGASWMLVMRYGGVWNLANAFLNCVLLGFAAVLYTVWIFAVSRGWISTATGGGFVVAGHAVILRTIVEAPMVLAQVPLAEAPPPEPYGAVLLLGRGFGLVAYVGGLSFVAAACLSERRLRRILPRWGCLT